VKHPQTPRHGTVNFLQRVMLREESQKAMISELLAKTLMLEAENALLRDMLSISQPVCGPGSTGTTDAQQTQ
jgi:hypothetical protein